MKELDLVIYASHRPLFASDLEIIVEYNICQGKRTSHTCSRLGIEIVDQIF